MTPLQLRLELEKKYNILGFIDLGELSESPTSAFKLLEPLYQERYNIDDRIIIFTGQAHIPDLLLEHLYKTSNFLDISNWFILFCTSNNLDQQLTKVCKYSSTDPVPFQHTLVELEETRLLMENYELPETMCAIPWSNLEIRSNGDITPCCMFTGSFGNINKDTLLDVFHGTDMNQLREDFVGGQKPNRCRKCWDKEDQGLTSIRQHNIKRIKKSFLTEQFDHPTINYLDIKFQNTCNFKCRICDPKNSSLFAEENSKFKKIPVAPQIKWSESDSFAQQINDLLPKINNIDMYGGEPFLIKKFVSVLESAIKQGHAKNIRLHYNSNGSVWPGHFVEYWKHFQHVDIHFSIDAVGQQFELQRGGKWEDVESNILRIKNLNYQNMSISIMPAVSIMNVYYIDQVIEWANKHNFQVFVSHVTNPIEYALSELTPEAKNIILEKHKNNPWPEMQKILELLRSLPVSHGLNFCRLTNWFDSIRKENFAKAHPEIANAMGYVYNNNNL